MNLKTDELAMVLESVANQAIAEWNKAFVAHVQAGLETLGYLFNTEEEFLDFSKKRITRVMFDGQNFELYLDFKSTEDKGILLGIYCTEAKFFYDKNGLPEKIVIG